MEIIKDSSRIKLIVALATLMMALSAVAFVPADMSDADGDFISVSTWDELKDAAEDGPDEVYIILKNDIEVDDDAIEIGDERYVEINLAGFKIDGCGDERLFEISGDETTVVYIYDGTLTGGRGDDGGCIYIDTAKEVHLENVNLIGNYSDDDGGAIYVEDKTLLEITGGKIADNACDGDGGAIYAEDDCCVKLKDVEIYGNHADDGDGGVLYSEYSVFEIRGCNIHDNYCSEDGGVIYAEGVTQYFIPYSIISGTIFSGNHTEDDDDSDGGAIRLYLTDLRMDSSTFDGNHCGCDGGAIYAEESELRINSSTTFKNNSVPESGGGLRLRCGLTVLTDTIFENNHADANGGAIYANNGARLWITNITMTGNNVLGNGGGLLMGADKSDLSGSDNEYKFDGLVIIKDNTAKGNGSNVFIRSGQKIVCGEFEEGTAIGIELAKGTGKFTEKYSYWNEGIDPAKIFFSDNSKYYVALDPDSGEAKTYKESTGDDMSNDNTVWIVAGVIAAVVLIGAAAYFFIIRKP